MVLKASEKKGAEALCQVTTHQSLCGSPHVHHIISARRQVDPLGPGKAPLQDKNALQVYLLG